VKYGLLTCLGRNEIFSPDLMAALGLALPVAWLPEPLLLELLRVVPPHAAVNSTVASATAVTALRLSFLGMGRCPFRRVGRSVRAGARAGVA
jgi:hypothetical protein